MATPKKLHLNKTELKVLQLSLKDDDRVQNHYSQQVFNCHYLSDYVSKLRIKLGNYFKDDGFNIIKTENHIITKIDGTKTTIGIYRIEPNYRSKIEKITKDNQLKKPTNMVGS